MKKKVIIRCIIVSADRSCHQRFNYYFYFSGYRQRQFLRGSAGINRRLCTEISAVLLQAVLSLLYGAAFAGASVIWENENWSLLTQTFLHLVICSLATFPTAYITRWMSHDTRGILSYFGIFFAIYAIIWISQYTSMKKIRQMNDKVKQSQGL